MAPRAEDVGDGGVRDEVDVALAVARLDVGEAVPLLGERAVRLRERPEIDAAAIDSSPRLVAVSAPRGLDDVAHVHVAQALVPPLHDRLVEQSWISPVRSRRRMNERPPVDRSAITRPHT